MSTVLRPVGPLGRRVYWIRRCVLLGAIVIIILLVATQCAGGSGGGGNAGGNTGAGHPSTAPTNTQPTKPAIGACAPHALKLSVSTDTTTYTSGQAPTLTATLTNTSSTTCKLARSVDAENWTIASGPATVWTTQGCSSGATPVPAQAKIAAGATKQIHMTWNGNVRVRCKDTHVAAPGHYKLTATIDGIAATHPALFTIIQ